MAGESHRSVQGDLPRQARSRVFEDLLEHPGHREHRRPRVDATPARLDLAHLSAGTVRGVERRHLEAAGRKAMDAAKPPIPAPTTTTRPLTVIAVLQNTCCLEVQLVST